MIKNCYNMHAEPFKNKTSTENQYRGFVSSVRLQEITLIYRRVLYAVCDDLPEQVEAQTYLLLPLFGVNKP